MPRQPTSQGRGRGQRGGRAARERGSEEEGLLGEGGSGGGSKQGRQKGQGWGKERRRRRRGCQRAIYRVMTGSKAMERQGRGGRGRKDGEEERQRRRRGGQRAARDRRRLGLLRHMQR